MRPREAASEAERLASGYVSGGRTVTLSALTAPVTRIDNVLPVLTDDTAPSVASAAQGGLTNMARAVQMLTDNPALMGMSLRDLESRTRINRQTWSNAKRQLEYTRGERPVRLENAEVGQ
jgi:hypothetical protein